MSSNFFSDKKSQVILDVEQVSKDLARAVQTAVNGNPFMKVENDSSRTLTL